MIPLRCNETCETTFDHVLEDVTVPLEQRIVGMQSLFGYLQIQVEDHIAHPRDDLTTHLLEAEMDITGLLKRD